MSAALATAHETLRDMLDKRRKWLASCERTLELLQPEWDRFQAREGHDIYVARFYADHTSEARTHRKEIAAIEAALSCAAALTEIRDKALDDCPETWANVDAAISGMGAAA